MNNLPEKFIIPKERIPKPWSQGLYGCCVAASITKVLEVINYVKTGKYVMFSKGYVYGKHNHPNKRQEGMDYTYAMESLLKHGTVPEEMFPIMNEMPNIRDDVNNHPNIDAINKEAEKTRIKSYYKIPGTSKFNEILKTYLYEKQMPIVGNMTGKRHCTVIVGWDGDKFLYHDHNGKETLYRGKFNEAYYLEGDFEMKKFKDVEDDRWSKKYVDKIYKEGIMLGVSEEEFKPTEGVTREQLAAVLCRALFGME